MTLTSSPRTLVVYRVLSWVGLSQGPALPSTGPCTPQGFLGMRRRSLCAQLLLTPFQKETSGGRKLWVTLSLKMKLFVRLRQTRPVSLYLLLLLELLRSSWWRMAPLLLLVLSFSSCCCSSSTTTSPSSSSCSYSCHSPTTTTQACCPHGKPSSPSSYATTPHGWSSPCSEAATCRSNH